MSPICVLGGSDRRVARRLGDADPSSNGLLHHQGTYRVHGGPQEDEMRW